MTLLLGVRLHPDIPRRRFLANVPRGEAMTMYSALTVRKLKPGTYDQWRKAWEGDEEDMPEGVEVYVLRNLKDPDEIIAFGLFEGDVEAMRASFDVDAERQRQEAMAPYIESVGADGMYEVIEHIGAKTGARN
jgi:hypothetical protein